MHSVCIVGFDRPLALVHPQASGRTVREDTDTQEFETVRAVWLAPLLSFFTVATYFAFHEVRSSRRQEAQSAC